MSFYKRIEKSNISKEKINVYKLYSLNSGSAGINSYQFRSGSSGLSGSHWSSLRVNYYLSGSNLNTSEQKYSNSFYSFGLQSEYNPQHRNKFYSSGSVLLIPQLYFGEEIKRNSFILTDNSTAKEIIIKDDSYGNLYSSNAHDSRSSVTSISSSDNYVGNIFYRTGVVTLTETGSWSSSIDYTDTLTGNYAVKFSSTHTIFTNEYVLKVKPREFNMTNNITARSLISGSGTKGNISASASPFLLNKLTGSGWSPYITTIGLYDNDGVRPVVVARLSQPIQVQDDMDLIFKIKLDL